jgi:hypothetical protein
MKKQIVKVLKLDVYYQLPDDFTGTFEDAVQSFADYCKNNTHKKKFPYDKDDELADLIREKDNVLWPKFMDKVVNGTEGFGYAGGVALAKMEHTCKNTKWTTIDVTTGKL